MKAQDGRIYARADRYKRICELWSKDTMPEWDDTNVNAIDVTDIMPVTPGMLVLNDGSIAPDPGPSPSEYHILDMNTGTWVIDPDVDTKKENEAVGAFDGKKELRTLFEVIFTIVNDVRELKGQQPVTRQALRRQILDIYKGL